jgi:PleD family two-component response regulator
MRNTPSILVVDDSPFAARALVHVLESRGLQARDASSMEEAMRICTEYRPSLLVTDARMPDIDLLDLCERFRAASGRQSTAVLLFSASSEDTLRDIVAAVGADAFIEKCHGAAAVADRVAGLCAEIECRQTDADVPSVLG